jgi:hypothetical protein
MPRHEYPPAGRTRPPLALGRPRIASRPTRGQNARLTPQDLEKIAGLTLEHYNRNAEDFREGTRDHDVSQNIEALLRAIEGDPPFPILDFGCGPGRDRGRYGVYHDLESWRRYLSAAGFAELTHYYRPSGLPRAQQPWLASVWRKLP